MSFPADGSYFTFRLDPVASLQDIEDKQVVQAARRLSVKEYVACLTWTFKPVGVPQLPPAYEVANIDLVQQGLPPEIPDELRESRMCVPIRPNTQHPDGRRTAHCCHPLPWDGCYHVAAHRTRVRIRTEVRPIDPPHSLAPAECSDSSDYSESDDGGHDAPVRASAHSENDVPDNAATDPAAAVDDIADVEDAILTALNHRADLGNISPVIVPLSYDLSTLTAPPSPTGFIEELEAIRKIRSDYEERVRRLKEEVQRRDDEFMADIQARRIGEPPIQIKWPLLRGFLPFTNRVRARFGANSLFCTLILAANMSFPDNGAYYTFRLDPVASLQDIEDEEVVEAARRISPQIYVASTIMTIGAPQLPPAYEVATIALVQQGLPPDKPDEFLESRMCVPIRPNTRHPEGRRPAHCCHPLPWDDCYHVSLHSTRVRVRTDCRDEDPPHSLGSPECVTLRYMIQDDEQRREILRNCAAKGISPPPPASSDMTLACIDGADSERSDTPYWQILAARRAERLARPPLQLHVEIDENWDAETDFSDASDYSYGSSAHPADPPASGPTHSGLEAREAQNEVARETAPAVDNIAEVENDILAALIHRADLSTISPVIVPLSYDLSTLPAPPSPTGFMEELSAIRKIRSDYEERVRKRKEEVQRLNDEYMADIQARRTGEPPLRFQWALGIAPFTRKAKARWVSLRRRSASVPSTSPSKVTPGKLRLLILSSFSKRSARS
ncbi:hypothetical protein EV715DRAFT_276083 [Schizophyllum commune]